MTACNAFIEAACVPLDSGHASGMLDRWTHLRAPDSVEALLRAGASPDGVAFPSGYPEVDELLRAHRR